MANKKRRRLNPRPPKERPIENPLQALVEDTVMNAIAAAVPRHPGLRSALDHFDRLYQEAQKRGLVPEQPTERPPVIQLTKQEDGSYK